MEKLSCIVAIPHLWLRQVVARIFEAARVKCHCVESMAELNQAVSDGEDRMVLVIVDVFSYTQYYRDIFAESKQKNPGLSILALVSTSNEGYRYELMTAGASAVVIKEEADEELFPALIKVLRDKKLNDAVARLLENQKQWITLIKEEVTELEKEEQKGALQSKLSRRTFLKASAVTAAATGAIAANPWGPGMKALVTASESPALVSEEKLVSSACRSNCFQSCRLNAHVRDGKLVKTTPAPWPDGEYTGCCLKGLSLVQRTYSPTRIKHPLRRVGERGEDKWEVISWDEAITEISEKFMDIQAKYGPKSLAFDIGSGNYGLVHGCLGIFNRLTNSIGCTKLNVCYDQATGYGADRVIGGSVWLWGNEPRTMMDAKTIIIWGSNPVYSQPQNWRILKEAQKNGTKVITIDPIYSATANKSDEYIPIVPGSDLMLALAMIKYIMDEDLIDVDFVKKRSTAPFLVRKDNGKVLRKSDFVSDIPAEEDDYYVWDSAANSPALLKEGPQDVAIEGAYTIQGVKVETVFTLLKNHVQEYTLEKASDYTKIPVEKIKDLVKAYVSGPTMIYTNYGIDHYQNGHLWSAAAFMMASLTGNIGVKGAGFTGLFVQNIPFNYVGMYVTNGKMADGTTLPQTEFYKAVRDQALEGKPYPIKAMYTTSSNSMSNWAQQNTWFTDILPNLEFNVVVDTELTDTARYADIVLPASFWFEVNDLRTAYNNPYIYMQEKAIEPLYESKPDAEIIAMIAHKMGLGQYFPKDMDDTDWIKVLLDSDDLRKMGITYDRLMEEKVVRGTGSAENPFVRGEAFFYTPTGRAQLYCENPLPRVNYGQDLTGIIEKERLPYFKPPGEAWRDNPLFAKYPLVFIQEHAKYRTHTQWYNVPLLRELDPEPLVKISREDAEIRGIKTGDIVEVFNDRGKAVVKAEVNDSISTGVISIPKGWQREQFIEGCFQELTNATSDPMAVNFAYFDCLVDVKKR
ncbi:anaerobic dehydrogenase, typically selenocysteine-containing [Desulfitobacterium dichloroeliminans LMG P-21439]|uniref:Anaerobic dehydrogenase, typically selenocysteine-containing n=1 Tax=Desulfitobacterium dichloroeliminans (strain LMG P-21439 / DCA1) TaxID=871963 RepID=L0FCG2_DESDL|nr:molybdopterin-dependent oxidoreductase [Desulfitobacterium dichloroeliminans]AGA70346.1 anaerobic dehydrogenase, typically selenocysteine-containing [Desulfitobacterium dichloroeliminans LMG P-21439]